MELETLTVTAMSEEMQMHKQKAITDPLEHRSVVAMTGKARQPMPKYVTPPPAPASPPPSRKAHTMRSVMEAVEALKLPVITSNQAHALACRLNGDLGL